VLAYVYHPAAEAEYHEAIQYYRNVRPELGQVFVREIESAVERARVFPTRHPRISGELRRVLTRRFSYMVVFEILNDRILVWAVAHTRREPGYWKSRLPG
jgi:toxin ParE1/3/4